MLEPVAWRHTLHMELNQTTERLTASPENPFGKPGRDYSEEYEVTSTPLHALPEPAADLVEVVARAICTHFDSDIAAAVVARDAILALKEQPRARLGDA